MIALRSVARVGLFAASIALLDAQAPLFRTAIDVVRIDALVLDDGKPVPNLRAPDFEVLDSGVRQSIRVTPLADVPLDVIVALDVSASVAGERLQQLAAGVGSLSDSLTPADRVALVSFSHLIAVQAAFDRSRAGVLAAVGELAAAGNTSILDGVSVGLGLAEPTRPTLLLVFSDGVDTASWLEPAQVLEQAHRSHVVVDAVVVGELTPANRTMAFRDRGFEWTPTEEFLASVTDATGGQEFDGEDGRRLGARLVEALALFRQRYEITFTSTVDRNGWHPLEVRVPGRRGVTVRARPGYSR
jgi:VWFA-related protein